MATEVAFEVPSTELLEIFGAAEMLKVGQYKLGLGSVYVLIRSDGQQAGGVVLIEDFQNAAPKGQIYMVLAVGEVLHPVPESKPAIA